MIQQVVFIITLGAAAYFIRKRVLRIRANINLGKANKIEDRPGERLRNMILVAFGQKKMFKRPIPAILHFFIYVGFLVINIADPMRAECSKEEQDLGLGCVIS